jgi:CRP/FNR family transcriptional regulator, cyclic AMP receptor protein
MSLIRDDSIRFLETSPLFAGLSRRQTRGLGDQFSEGVFAPGHRILSKGMDGMEFFVIVDGTVEVSRDDEVLAVLGPGDFFGEVASVDGGPHTATVRTMSQVRCLFLANRSLRPFLLEHPQVAVRLVDEMVRRFRAMAVRALA